MNREIRGITSLFRAALEVQQNRAAKEVEQIEALTKKQTKAEKLPIYIEKFLESATRWTYLRFQQSPDFHTFTGYIDRSIIPYVLALQFVTHNYEEKEQDKVKTQIVKTCIGKTFRLSNQLLLTMLNADDAQPLDASEMNTHIQRAQNLSHLVVPEDLKKYYEYTSKEEQFEFETIWNRIRTRQV